MRAIPVRLPGKAYDTPLFENYTPDLLSKIIKITSQDYQQRLLEEIYRVLDLTQRKTIDQYSRQLKDLEKRFCQTLKDHFRESCAVLISTQRKVVYLDLNESILFTLSLSRTTVTDSLSSKSSEPPETGTKMNNSILTSSNSSQNSINGSSNELKIECLAESDHSQGISGHLNLSITRCRLTYKAGRLVEEARDIQENSSSSPVIDADYLKSILILHEKKKIHVAASDTMLEISWTSEI
ncbi:hypothetical protein ACJ72_01324 [Emergomyces africanus]|uniref:Uncharacterized protein n=1 Tax=Emergomyces africanus TaxID=1955775 RepID=A0A1B7P5I9_9EURO|nr:hypothetical protein ACJ72_01324 [Emergomyces africanus]